MSSAVQAIGPKTARRGGRGKKKKKKICHSRMAFISSSGALKLNGLTTISGLPHPAHVCLAAGRRPKASVFFMSFRHEQNAGYAAAIAAS